MLTFAGRTLAFLLLLLVLRPSLRLDVGRNWAGQLLLMDLCFFLSCWCEHVDGGWKGKAGFELTFALRAETSASSSFFPNSIDQRPRLDQLLFS